MYGVWRFGVIGLVKYLVAIAGRAFIADNEPRNEESRLPGRACNLPGEKMIEAINTTEIEIAFIVFPNSSIAEFIALKPVDLLVIGNFSFAVDAGQAFVAADPDMAGAILFNGMNSIIG